MCLTNTPTVCENVPIDKLRKGKYNRLNLDHCACAKTAMFRHMAKYRVNKRNCDQVAFNELIKNLNCWFPESEYPSLVYPRIKTTLQRLFNQLVETQIVTSIELNNGGWASTWPAFTQNWLENDWNGDTGNQLAAAGLTPGTTRSQAQDNPIPVRRNSGRPGTRSSPIVIGDGHGDLGLSFSGLSIHERHRQPPPPFIRSTPRRPISDVTPSFIHPGLPTPPRSSPGFPAGSSTLETDFFRPAFIHPLPKQPGPGHNIASSVSMAPTFVFPPSPDAPVLNREASSNVSLAQTFIPPGSGQSHTSAASVTLAPTFVPRDDPDEMQSIQWTSSASTTTERQRHQSWADNFSEARSVTSYEPSWHPSDEQSECRYEVNGYFARGALPATPVSDRSPLRCRQSETRPRTFQQHRPQSVSTTDPIENWRQTVTQQTPSGIVLALNRERDAAFARISDQAGLQQLVADDQHAIDICRLKGLLAVVNKTHRSGEGSSRGASEIGNSLKKLQDPLPLAPSFANMMEQEDAFEKLRKSLLVKILGTNVKGRLGEGSGKAATILHQYYSDGLARSNT